VGLTHLNDPPSTRVQSIVRAVDEVRVLEAGDDVKEVLGSVYRTELG